MISKHLPLVAALRWHGRRPSGCLWRYAKKGQARLMCSNSASKKKIDGSLNKEPVSSGKVLSDIKRRRYVGALAGFGVAAWAFSSIMYAHEIAQCQGTSRSSDGEEADSLLHSVEPVSKTSFPVQLLKYSGPDSTHWLVAKAIRCMFNICYIERARAYSYAVYVSSEAAQLCKDCSSTEDIAKLLLPERALIAERDQESRKEDRASFIPADRFTGGKEGYYFGLKTENGGLGYHRDDEASVVIMAHDDPYPSMCLRLVFLRSVDASHIAHGFDRSLLNRIRHAQGGARDGQGKAALRELNRFIELHGNWEKGTTLDFIRLPEGRVNVRVDGKDSLSVQSESFSWALFDAYIGSNGHLPTASRNEFVQRTKEVASLYS